MLNGVAPILIFQFFDSLVTSAVQGIPIIGDVAKEVGVPIPIYLNEGLTGVFVESESKSLDIDTDVQISQDPKVQNQYSQRGVQNLVTINMFAKRDSLLLAIFLALNDIVFSKVISRNYQISYLNGPTVILGGLLHGFSATAGSDDDLIRLSLQLQKGKSKAIPNPIGGFSTPLETIQKFTGETPISAGGLA